MKFSHLADCHIGAFREEKLKELNLKAFEIAIDKSIKEKVDFILISGDLFHSNIPDLAIVDKAVKKIKFAIENGIQIYVVYGSHDYSANSTSIIDILCSAGILKKVVNAEFINNKLKLNFIEDEKTKVKIFGLSGRRGSLEKEYFSNLDLESMEKERGIKIFAFHSAIREEKPIFLSEIESIPISNFPKGFDYYAGGHVHKRIEVEKENYGKIVFPGTTFASEIRDLELLAGGDKNGFYIVDIEDNNKKSNVKTKFVELKIADVKLFEINANNKSSLKVNEELHKIASEDLKDKIVLIKIRGELASGKPSDIDINSIQERLLKIAIAVKFSKHDLTSKEEIKIQVKGENKEEIEDKLFKEKFAEFKIENKNLQIRGIEVGKELLHILKEEKKENEKKNDYEERILRSAYTIVKKVV